MKLLARKDRSEQEVRSKLERAGIDPASIDPTIERLKQLCYLDDATTARSRAAVLLEKSCLSPAVAIDRLCAQGISQDVAAQAVREVEGGLSERDRALQSLARRQKNVSADSELSDRLRAARWLAARGFSEQVIRELLNLPL